MPPEDRVQAVCAMSVEAWGVRRRAKGIRVAEVGIGGSAAPGDASIVISAGLCGGLLPDQAPGSVMIATSVVRRDRGDACLRPGGRCPAGARRAIPRIRGHHRLAHLDERAGHRIRTVRLGGARPRGGGHGVGRCGRDGAALRHRSRHPRHPASRAVAGVGASGTRDPQPRELAGGAVAGDPHAAIRAPGRRGARGGLPPRYRRPGIAAPHREASARHRARRTPAPSRAARRAAHGARPRPPCSPLR